MRQAVKHLHAGNEGHCSSRVFLHGSYCWKSPRGLPKIVVWPSKAPHPAGVAVCPNSAVILFTSTCFHWRACNEHGILKKCRVETQVRYAGKRPCSDCDCTLSTVPISSALCPLPYTLPFIHEHGRSWNDCC